MSLRILLAVVALMWGVSGAAAQDKKDSTPSQEKSLGAAERQKMLKEFGGNTESEAAVARGLAWLARVQQKDGPWKFDGSSTDQVAATGMALLPFFAVGQAHTRDDKHQKTVAAGLEWLQKQQKADGSFTRASNMYAHALATLALCDALRVSKDDKLKDPAKKAAEYIVKAQGTNGSWGYKAGTEGDTSIVGWQIQALASARRAGIKFEKDKVYEKAEAFLKSVSTDGESKYGYREKGNGPSLSASALLSRYYMGWAPRHPSYARGADLLLDTQPPSKLTFDMYYYYYATQVFRYLEGEKWEKKWNPKMRDLLVELQHKGGPAEKLGSWDKDGGFIGASCGRLGTTALAVLTLEVYYRYPPLYKRDVDLLKELDK